MSDFFYMMRHAGFIPASNRPSGRHMTRGHAFGSPNKSGMTFLRKAGES